MNWTIPRALLVACLLTASAHAATINGSVINKTTGKPSTGDKVALVDLSAGMADAATTVAGPEGKFALQASGPNSYLIRVDHQGAGYFIAAPQNGSPARVTVYDVAAKVEGVGIDADMLLIEAGQGSLHVRERYLVRNTSSPPRTQFSENTFEVALPEGALLEEAAATRPGGMGTRTRLTALAQKGHYSFNVPIQPDQDGKETMYEIAYHFPYNGRQTITVHPITPADHVVVYTAQGIKFASSDASRFKAEQEDARVETHVALNVHPGEKLAFTVSGEGRMPSDANATAMSLGGSNASVASAGAGIAAPIGSPDPLTGSKNWLLMGGAVLLAGVAFLSLRRPQQPNVASKDMVPMNQSRKGPEITQPIVITANPPADQSSALLETLKEELFTLEQEKIAGRIPLEEYAQIKAGLDAVLKRALKVDRMEASEDRASLANRSV